ncbi:hypothetical protein H0H87_008288 [Tephrocybe sp. NHM501043]|nr:hypothetical protein H0H87_008288 [Tephrocybe sp. NHM501043]
MALVFVNNAIGTGALKPFVPLSISICYRKHFLPTALTTSLISLFLEFYLSNFIAWRSNAQPNALLSDIRTQHCKALRLVHKFLGLVSKPTSYGNGDTCRVASRADHDTPPILGTIPRGVRTNWTIRRGDVALQHDDGYEHSGCRDPDRAAICTTADGKSSDCDADRAGIATHSIDGGWSGICIGDSDGAVFTCGGRAGSDSGGVAVNNADKYLDASVARKTATQGQCRYDKDRGSGIVYIPRVRLSSATGSIANERDAPIFELDASIADVFAGRRREWGGEGEGEAVDVCIDIPAFWTRAIDMIT